LILVQPVTNSTARPTAVDAKTPLAGRGGNASIEERLANAAASWLVMQGVDLYAVGQLLGHRTPRMTQRYAHRSPQYMAGAVGKLDPVFGQAMPPNGSGEAHLRHHSVTGF
jgi:integrase